MRDTRIGRVLVASLHQAIADVLPDRLSFYENWLSVTGLRDGTIGLAPLYAVLSFLRQEGEVYQTIMERAGEYAAEWTVESLSSVRRRAIKLAPRWLRCRMLLRMAGQLVRSSNRDSRAIATLRNGMATVDLHASIFCVVREPVPQPLCGFYAAAFTRLLTLFNIEAHVAMIACRGTGESACMFHVALAGASVRDS
jgi:predicted hydrocarbon binding protein